jgi:hypothetical protein
VFIVHLLKEVFITSTTYKLVDGKTVDETVLIFFMVLALVGA